MLIIGLFLFGIALSLRFKLDCWSLWGCIGLHGGLVSFWSILNSGLIELSDETSVLIVGPGIHEPNPLGGFLGITALICLIYFQRKAFAIDGLP